MSWLAKRETYERTIRDPESGEEATIVLRPLRWGDVLKLNEVRLEQDEDGEGIARLRPGDNKMLVVELALVSWSLDEKIGKPTRDVLQALNPVVGEQIYRHVDLGEGEADVPAEGREAPGPLAVSDDRALTSAREEDEPETIELEPSASREVEGAAATG